MFLFFVILASPLAILGEPIICSNKALYGETSDVNLEWVANHTNAAEEWYNSYMSELSYYGLAGAVSGQTVNKSPKEAAAADFKPFMKFNPATFVVEYHMGGQVRNFKINLPDQNVFANMHMTTDDLPTDNPKIVKTHDVVMVQAEDYYVFATFCWENVTTWTVMSNKPLGEEDKEYCNFLAEIYGFEDPQLKGVSFTY